MPLFVLVVYLHEGEKIAFLKAVRQQLAARELETRSLDPAHRPEHGISQFYKALAKAGTRGLNLVVQVPRVRETQRPDHIFLEYINLHRNLIGERKLRFVLCLHESEAETFIHVAGDLWDVRHKTYWLERPKGFQGERLWQELSEHSQNLPLSEAQQRNITEHIERVRELIRETRQPNDKAALLLDLTNWLLRRRALHPATEAALEGLALLPESPSSLRRDIEHSLGEALFLASQLQEALEHLEQSRLLSQHLSDRRSEGTILNNISQIYDAWKDYEKALSMLRESLAIRHEIGDLEGQSANLNNIGAILQEQGRPEEALTALQESLSLVREVGNREGEGATLNNIAQVYLSLDRSKEALEMLQESLSVFTETGDRAAQSTILNNIGQIYSTKGRHEDALSSLEQGLSMAREVGDRAGEGRSLTNIAQVFSSWGRDEAALELLEQSLAIRREIGDRSGEAATSWIRSLVHERRGDLDQAVEWARLTVEIHADLVHPDLEKERVRLEELTHRLNSSPSCSPATPAT